MKIEPIAWLVEGRGTGGIPYRVATVHEAYSVARDGETSNPLFTADQIREAIERTLLGWAPIVANNEKQTQQCRGAHDFADALLRELGLEEKP